MPADPVSILSASVVFLFVGTSDVPIGTGFVVGIPVASRPNTIVPCIVTAKHVLAGHATINARFTPKAGKPSPRLNVDLNVHRANGDVWEHPDPGVDIIAFRALHTDDADYSPIPMDLLVTKALMVDQQIHASDRVLFPSLLVNFLGANRNYPTVRDGSIALIPDELVPLEYQAGAIAIKTSQELLFLNAISVPGASGSPVFLSPGPRTIGNAFVPGGIPYLLGIMHGFYAAQARPTIEVETTDTKHFFRENAGIALVFPAWRLREILESDRVKARVAALVPSTP